MSDYFEFINTLFTYLGIGFLMAIVLYQDFGVAVSAFAVNLVALMGPVLVSYFVLGFVIIVLVFKFARLWLLFKDTRRS